MTDARSLFPYFLHLYPFQPATAFWRSAEIAALLEHGLPMGLGLDVGCGDGLLTGIINERLPGTRSWVGIDPDAAEIALASQTSLYGECIITEGGALPFDEGRFDFALSNSVLEHIPDLYPVLSEVARVLKKGGHFVFTVPSNNFHALLYGPLIPYLDREKYLETIDKRCAHIHYLSEGEWRSELNKVGLHIAVTKPYLTKAETHRWEACSRVTGGLLYALFGKTQRPIDIQRSLGMRKIGTRLPMPLAQIAAWILNGPLDKASKPPLGCLLIDAIKA